MMVTSSKKMALRDFTRSLRRGLGSAIIELKCNPEKGRYHDIVMRSCLRDIAYDTQIEGTKGYYLYTAICEFNDPETFLNSIADKFEERLYWRLSEQLYDILCLFSDDGYEAADIALEKKYYELKKRLPITDDYSTTFCEREQFESLMIRKLDKGFEAFEQCINDMGEMIGIRGNDDCLWYDSFWEYAKEKYGKDIYSFMETTKNENATVFFNFYMKSKSDELDRHNLKIMTVDSFCKTFTYEKNPEKEERITVDQLVKRSNELAQEKDSVPLRISPLSRKFAATAKKEELETLASIALNEPSVFIKTALLRVFDFADFPFDIGLLFSYTCSDDVYLRDVSAKALSRIKDNRLNALALQLFEAGLIENAITVLTSSFVMADEVLIRKYLLRSKRVTYDMIVGINDIYQNHQSGTCGDILLHFYKNVECTHCRCEIVETMIANDVIPRSILDECQYDSYERTREIAKRTKDSAQNEKP